MATAHCEWGPNGMLAFRERARVLVIVDVLSFSTAVDVAVARGASIVPFPLGDREAAAKAAEEAGAVLASATRGGSYSLAPSSLETIPPGTKLLLPSPNGSRLSLMGGEAVVFAGCLRNARAVAAAALRAAQGGDIAVIPAGERWRLDDSLRPAIEDLIGAGAVLDALGLELSPEAQVARDAYLSAKPALAETIWQSISGRELIDRGFPRDVALAVEAGVSTAAPLLTGGVYRNANA